VRALPQTYPMSKFQVLFLSFLLLSSGALGARDPLKKMANSIGKSIRHKDKPRVALLAFPYHDGRVSSGSSIVSERLTTYLVGFKGLRVIERRLISSLLKEQRLMETGVLDRRTAKQIGKVLGVDIIITGTLIDLDEKKTEVNARGVLADTGEVIVASRAIMKRSWKDRPRIVRPPGHEDETKQEVKEEKNPENDLIEIGYPVPRRSYGGRRGRRFR